ncbi:hypothetical protein GCM10010975_12030 [Comamonas phosphati]|nr:hypothetical protein GCM10010975_12030 [Comamonas phosphati]
MFLDEAEHGVRVPALGSDGKPLLRISHAAQSFGDFGNGRWICIDIVTWLLEKGRVAKPTRQVECVELMVATNNITVSYAQALLAATPPNMLINEGGPKKVKGVSVP